MMEVFFWGVFVGVGGIVLIGAVVMFGYSVYGGSWR